ncbi:MAG TPA: 6-phosphogluconolactonase, partial [Bacteroidales bacterium]|nr:6-phosphogluconolactonase [Bacteroidales bacterium]
MSDNPNLNTFSNKDKLAAHLAADLINRIRGLLKEKEYVYIALSGGRTPNVLFQHISASSLALDWDRVKFFWVDERCVPPDHNESNYGSAKPVLIDPLGLSDESVYRIKGENDPGSEAKSYGDIIQSIVSPELNSTVFDIILLGMGE